MKVYILYGEMGAGKNYVGEHWSYWMNLPFIDGDRFATLEVINRIYRFKPLSRRMVSDFIRLLSQRVIQILANQNTDLILAQALYSQKDREHLRDQLVAAGHEVEFFHIRTSFWKNIKQLYSRPKGCKWVLYWLFNKPFFEK